MSDPTKPLADFKAHIEAVAYGAKTLYEAVPDGDSGGYHDSPMQMRQSHNTHCIHVAHQIWSQLFSEQSGLNRIEIATKQREAFAKQQLQQLQQVAPTGSQQEIPAGVKKAIEAILGPNVEAKFINLREIDLDKAEELASRSDKPMSPRDQELTSVYEHCKVCNDPECQSQIPALELQLGIGSPETQSLMMDVDNAVRSALSGNNDPDDHV